MGTEVFAGAGTGKGGRGGFGGDLHIGYLKELDNNVVVGIGASAGFCALLQPTSGRGIMVSAWWT